MQAKYSFILDVDHFQFYLEDRDLGAKADTTCIWDDIQIPRQRIAVMPGLVAVSTARFSGRTTVSLRVQEAQPSLSLDAWDSVFECGLQLPSGEAILRSPESDLKQCPRVQVTPGKYGVVVIFEAITRVHDELTTEGPDAYHLVLWGPIDADLSIRALK